VDGGAGNDTIDLAYGLFVGLRVDGRDGFDTMIMRYPDRANPSRYTIDFNAGSFLFRSAGNEGHDVKYRAFYL
jgi:hypothetical protein